MEKATLRTNSNIQRAIKIIPKNNVVDLQRLRNEIKILSNIDHPNIIKLYEIYEDQNNM